MPLYSGLPHKKTKLSCQRAMQEPAKTGRELSCCGFRHLYRGHQAQEGPNLVVTLQASSWVSLIRAQPEYISVTQLVSRFLTKNFGSSHKPTSAGATRAAECKGTSGTSSLCQSATSTPISADLSSESKAHTLSFVTLFLTIGKD